MALNIPESRRVVAQRIFADIQAILPKLNPFLRENLIAAISTGNAGRLFDIYKKLKKEEEEFFLQTAKDIIFIQRWGFLKNTDLKESKKATGFISTAGTLGANVPQGTIYNVENDNEYETIETDYFITEQTINVTSIVSDGTNVTVTTGAAHNYAKGLSVTIAGATPGDFNGTFTVETVGTDDDAAKFQYLKTMTPGSGSGSITSTSTFASMKVRSLDVGSDKNLDANAQVDIKNSLSGIADNAYVQFSGIGGGADEETPPEYKGRVEDAWRNPRSHWNKADVEQLILSVEGVTRPWVFEITPEIGESTSYFVRDNDTNPIPSPQEIQDVLAVLLFFKPADRKTDWIHVLAPTPVYVDFTFTGLVPNSLSMRNAIKDSLGQFFREKTNVSESITEDIYRSVIQGTINPETGEVVQSFVLSAPVGDITISDGELGFLGNVDFIV